MGQQEGKGPFSENQSVILSDGSGVESTYAWQAAAGIDDQGDSKISDFSTLGQMRIEFLVGDTALVGSGCTLTLAVYEHTAATGLETGNLIWSKDVLIGAGGIAIGTKIGECILPQGEIDEVYLGTYYSAADAAITAGTVSAFPTDHAEKLT